MSHKPIGLSVFTSRRSELRPKIYWKMILGDLTSSLTECEQVFIVPKWFREHWNKFHRVNEP